MRLAIIALLLLSTSLSYAQQAPSLYLDLHGLSYHPVKGYKESIHTHTVYSSEGDVLSIEETVSTRPFNQFNKGMGLTYRVSPLSSYSIGSYHNSYYRTTTYITYNHTMYNINHTTFILSGGVASGYSDSWIPVVIPSIVFGRDVQVKVGGIPKSGENTTGAVFVSVAVKLF